MNFYLESLGCPKNLVDSHSMARQLKRLGYIAVGDPSQAQVLIVNTCGFIEDAREESLDELRQLAQHKRDNQVLVAAGCLSQRWEDALLEAVPGVDALLGTRRWHEIDALVKSIHADRKHKPPTSYSWLGDPRLDFETTTRVARQGASAYLKIADGCSAPCAFCAIPLIKGPAHSRPKDVVIQDAIELVHQGVKEIILIAQDTTAYGRDRGESDALSGLIQGILDAFQTGDIAHPQQGLHWLRLMYAYPGHISPQLIDIMANDPRACHYLDLPLQHAHPATLKRMRRPANIERTRQLIANLRAAMPDIALRTAFILGYPGETDSEFAALLDFIADIRFDRVGSFLYSPEEGTPAATLPGRIPEEIKIERLEQIMELQQTISLEANEAQIGRTLDVLIEGKGDGLSIGRSYRDAPEIDGMVLIPAELPLGKVASVRISGAMEYDLTGEIVQENKTSE